MLTRRLTATAGFVCVAAVAATAATGANRKPPPPTPYDRYTLSANNVAVTGAPAVKAFPRASIVVPREWRRLSRDSGRITFRSSSRTCALNVRFTLRIVAAPAGAAMDHVVKAVPTPGPRNVQDSGERGASAWRVVRQPRPTSGIDGMHAYATSAVVGALPAGTRAWVELAARARTTPQSSDCHAGHYRTVSRQIGDAFAVNTRPL